MSNSTDTAIVVAGLGAMLQLFRVSADLISTASEKDAVKDQKLEETSAQEMRAQALAPSSRKNKNTQGGSTAFFDGRFSLTKKAKSGLTLNDGQAGLGENSASLGGTDHSKLSLKKEQGEEPNAAEPTEEQELGAAEKVTIRMALLVNVAFGCYFVAICILDAIGSSSATDDIIYSAIPAGCAATAFWFAALMCLRDYQRQRFSQLQRTLHVLSALLLALGIIFQVALSDIGGSIANFDIASIVILVVYALLVLVECKIIQWPTASINPSSQDKKAKLSKRAILVVLKPYFWPDATASSATLNRVRALATWFFVIASKVCSLLSPIYIGKASTELTRMNYEETIRNVIYYCLLTFAAAVLKECQSLVYLRVAQAAFVQLAEITFHHLHSLSLDWHLKKKLGEVIRSMDRGILACDTLVKYLFLWLVPALAECILVAIIFATYFDDFALAVSVFFFVFAYLLLTVLLTLWRKKFRKEVAKSDNDWHDVATDSLINFETVKFFTAEESEKEKFGRAVEAFQSGSVKVAASLSTLNIAQKLLLQACLATSLSLATLSIKDRVNCCVANGCDSGNSECCSSLGDQCSGMEVGDFVAVLTYTIQLFTPLNFLGSVYNAIVMALVDLANLSELLAENPDVPDAKDAIDLPKTNASDPDTVIEFDNVKFTYPSQSESSGLKGVSFKMKRGTTTAVVGSTGAGKTTISRLLFRFYDVTGGAVKVNGVDVRTVKQKQLRDMIGVVPQAATLFNESLGDNIAYGKQGATQEELEEAATAAQLMPFINSLPERWDTQVGDRGLKLSGGEKQRAAIARCILKNPPALIFDEATSSLDTITEQSVKEALDRLGSDRTVLVIAHRLGTIKNADNIIVLKEGIISEQGTHDQLLERGGQYAIMWNMQLSSTKSSQATLLEE